MDKYLGWLCQDLRFALRSLNKSRRFSFLAILALALGIGSVTIIFSAVYGVLIDTFPYVHFDRMVSFSIDGLGQQYFSNEMLSIPEFLDYREQNHVFVDMEGGNNGPELHYTHGNQTTQWTVTRETANGYLFFGVKPLLGRLITPDDEKPGAPPVFMLTYKVWNEQFNKDPSIVGKTFDLNGQLWTLVGIMPPRFRAGWTDAFTAFPLDRGQIAEDPTLQNNSVWPLGFLKPGVTVQQAAADLDVVAHHLAKVYPQHYPKHFRVTARTFQARVNPMFEHVLYPLLWAVLLLFLIASTNVANLLLSRASARDREIAVRASLGASRWRLVRQLLVESFVLAVAGCAGGCFFAYLGIKELVPLIPYENFPQESVIALNWIVLLAAMALAVLATILCGLVPAIHAVGGSLQARLAGPGAVATSRMRHGKLRSALVVAEVSLSIVLLIGAGLMLRTFFAMTHVDLGFNPRTVLTVQMDLPRGLYDSPIQHKQFFDELLPKVKSLPGVLYAAEALSPESGGFDTTISIPGATYSGLSLANLNLVGEDYFQIFSYRLLRGRTFTAEEIAAKRPVAVVNEAFARSFLSKSDPLSQKVDFAMYDQVQLQLWQQGQKSAAAPGHAASKKPPAKTYFDVVGVISNSSMDQPAQPTAYLPSTMQEEDVSGLAVRTTGNADKISGNVSQQIWSINHDIGLSDDRGSVESMLQKYSYAQPEFEFTMLSTFAGVGFLLVIIGVYSVMAYNVSLRTREFGIRMALGAQRTDILRMVLRRGAFLIGLGIAVGLFGAWAATRLIQNQLWHVKSTDPWTFSAVVILVITVGLLACFIPARRAMKVDPMVALRYE